MIKNINQLADRLKGIKVGEENLTPEKLLALVKDEKEVELTINQIHVLDETQLTELKGTIKKEGYEEGKVVGGEMYGKELKRKFNIDGEGKSIDVVSKYIQDKILADAKIEPEKKVKELSDSLTTIQNTFQQKEQEWTATVSNLQGQLEQKDIDFYATSNIPPLKGMKPQHAYLIYKQDRQLKKDESGNILIYRGGKPLKDSLEKPIDFVTDFTNFAKENNFLGVDGRGGGNDGGSFTEFKTMNDVMKHMESNKIDPSSSQGQEIIATFKKSQK